MKIEDLLFRQSDNNKIAIKYSDNNITYQQWHKAAQLLKRTILKMIKSDSKSIAIFLPNSIEYAIAYFGILYSKRVIVPIDPQSKEVEICSTVKYCEIDLIISVSRYKKILANSFRYYSNKVSIYYIDTQEKDVCGQGKKQKKTEELICEDVPHDVAIMLHTSGTTSSPKRVMLTHENIITNIESNICSLQLNSEDNVLIALPMYFGYCNTAQFLTQVYLGATFVIMDSLFMPKKFFNIVQKEKITSFTAVPSMLLMILEYRYYDKYDISTLKHICFGGGKMPEEKLRLLINKFSTVAFIQTYGQTECSPRVTALLAKDSVRKIGSVGKAIPGVNVKIVDENDNFLEPKKNGEIVVTGKNIMKGYFKNYEATSMAMRNGVLHTGDMGYLDEEGYLYLTGRIKNIIISGGINIYPEEIEMIISQYDGVKDVLVFGEEHEMLGEVPIAKVIVDETVDVGELHNYCYEKLAKYKVPIRFDKVECLEKTYNGKTKRHK